MDVREIVRFSPCESRENCFFAHVQKKPGEGDVVPDSWTKNWGPSVWDINGREQLKLES